MTLPPHHRSDGTFRNPWPEAAGDDALRRRFGRVVWEWVTESLPPDPVPEELPLAKPEIAYSHVDSDEVRITWVGHATFLLQLPGCNVLTDPVWSTKVSPVSSVGSKRFVPAVPDLEALPPVDAVLLSHDHYDHLDRPTVLALRDRFPGLTWFTPLGYRRWFKRLGVLRVVERDWWQRAEMPDTDYEVVATPARHWTRRLPWGTNSRLWCSWAIMPRDGEGHRVFFAGDSGYAPLFGEIGSRLGPFDVSLLPIGAYEPRWFMKPSHMNPEEAVQVYQDLGGTGVFVPTHWGTYRLTFEPPLEPPRRIREAWTRANLPEDDLRVLAHGETTRL